MHQQLTVSMHLLGRLTRKLKRMGSIEWSHKHHIDKSHQIGKGRNTTRTGSKSAIQMPIRIKGQGKGA